MDQNWRSGDRKADWARRGYRIKQTSSTSRYGACRRGDVCTTLPIYCEPIKKKPKETEGDGPIFRFYIQLWLNCARLQKMSPLGTKIICWPKQSSVIEKLKLHRAQSPFHKLVKTYPKWFAAPFFLLYPQLCPKWSLPTEKKANLTKNDDMVTETQTEQKELTESNEFNQQIKILQESRCLNHASNLLRTDQKEAQEVGRSHLSQRQYQNINQKAAVLMTLAMTRRFPSTLQW